jgi:hypothetical protein
VFSQPLHVGARSPVRGAPEPAVLLDTVGGQGAVVGLNNKLIANTEHGRTHATAVDICAGNKVAINGVEQVQVSLGIGDGNVATQFGGAGNATQEELFVTPDRLAAAGAEGAHCAVGFADVDLFEAASGCVMRGAVLEPQASAGAAR